jgi:hypothetical protein
MMRTVEVILAIVLLSSSLLIMGYTFSLPKEAPENLDETASSLLRLLDTDYSLSTTAFKTPRDMANSSSPEWEQLKTVLTTLLPPDIAFNLTVCQDGVAFYSMASVGWTATPVQVGNAFYTSPNTTFTVTPEKIGERAVTLYILNCSDAKGWWTTGYTASTLTLDVYKWLSSYFQKTVFVQNTTDFGKILNNNTIQGETVQNAVVINTFGEAVPIPAEYCKSPYSDNGYAYYCYFIGNMTRFYNWTWVSIVGYPLYYVSNTGNFTSPNDQNGWGIYGMKQVGPAGLNAFLRGLQGGFYSYNPTFISNDVGVCFLTADAQEKNIYYGIYAAPYYSMARAMKTSAFSGLQNVFNIIKPTSTYTTAAVLKGPGGGAFLFLGTTRNVDIRLTTLGILGYYNPRLFPTEYPVSGAIRTIVFQIKRIGG